MIPTASVSDTRSSYCISAGPDYLSPGGIDVLARRLQRDRG